MSIETIKIDRPTTDKEFPGESGPNFGLQTITDIIEYRYRTEPEKEAFTYLLDGEKEAIRWRYKDLKNGIALVGHKLSQQDVKKKRVLLLFEPGLAFITAYLATISSGAIAVPCHPPMGKSQVKRLWDMIESCEPTAILHSSLIRSTNAQFNRITELAIERDIHLIDVDIPAVPIEIEWKHPEIDKHDIAMLQYTSASTGDPKGVVVSQENLVKNCEEIYHWLGPDAARRGCIWLPPYHDMGLLGGIMQPLYAGFPLYFMSPMHFIQRPLRWLKALSDHKLSLTGAPNFAFQLCADAVELDEIKNSNIDLSCVKDIFCGSEPINPDTMNAFHHKYAKFGLNKSTINPCYGLAEITLFASGRPKGTVFKTHTFDQEKLDAGLAEKSQNGLSIVSCGLPASQHDIKIVNPETKTTCPNKAIGEIWLAGPSVTHGYWGNEKLTDFSFNNTLPGNTHQYYRTGDLGFIYDEELFVNGRRKELIIIRGRNLYPQDIERCALRSTPHLEQAGAAAFSVRHTDTESLVVVIELKLRAKNDYVDEITRCVTAAVRNEFNITPHEVYVGPRGTVPRTTSGKIQRTATKKAYENNELRAFKRAKS